MATIQICYRDSSGKVVCRDSATQRMMAGPGGKKPSRKEVRDEIVKIMDSLLEETPEYFVILYAPDGVEAPPAAQ